MKSHMAAFLIMIAANITLEACFTSLHDSKFSGMVDI